jgi:hypothetical protein
MKGERCKMAVIECVFTYNEETQEVLQEVHVVKLEASDTLTFVTHQKGFTLQSELNFPLMDLEVGDLAPVKYTNSVRSTDGVPKFVVYYHGDQGKFACGQLVAPPPVVAKATAMASSGVPVTPAYGSQQFQPWTNGAGQTVPDGGPGG